MTRERARRLSWRATAYEPTELDKGAPHVIRETDGLWYITNRGDPAGQGFKHAEEARRAAEEFVAARETLASLSTEALARELISRYPKDWRRSDSWGPSLELDGYELVLRVKVGSGG